MLAPKNMRPGVYPKPPHISRWAILLLCTLFLSGALASAVYHQTPALTTAYVEEAEAPLAADNPAKPLPASVQKGLPQGIPLAGITLQEEKPWEGKLLLIDEAHPVPGEAPPPNTLSLSSSGAGQVAVRTPLTATHPEVIEALKAMFLDGRLAGISTWTVWEGSRSNAQQLALQLERLGQHAQTMQLTKAAALAQEEVPSPGCSEHQLPYVVDIRLAQGYNATPDARPLSGSKDGQYLLANAWRFGFIHRYGDNPANPYADEKYHFRYVGAAHSTMMNALSMQLPEYLAFLHRMGAVTYYEGENPRYTVLCRKAEKGLEFSVPEGGNWECSMDNTGYVVLAVSYPPV